MCRPQQRLDQRRETGATETSGAAVNPALRDASTGSALNTAATPMTPLMAIASVAQAATPTSINHQNGELATTVSFNLAEGVSLSDAQAAIKQAEADIAMPTSVRGSFPGQRPQRYSEQNKQQPFLVAAAIVAIYIVLGILYESYVHPLTVLSTLPAAGVGAMLALLIFGWSSR
jgi:multidrug efflux pump